MFFKFYIHLMVFSLSGFIALCTEEYNTDDVLLHLFHQIEGVKKSMEIVNTRLDLVTNRPISKVDSSICPEKVTVNPLRKAKPIFDIRFDTIPQQCSSNVEAKSCAEASECHEFRSGIYNITDTRYSKRTFTVYCDNDNYDGDWLYILRRNDGSEMFNRSWNDYVNGFGNVAGEHWLGLEHIYALTNFYGPQELNVFVEDFGGETKFARYDNFAIENASQNYRLKSLGRYSGTAGDSLFNHLGAQFSTIDVDNDEWYKSCAVSSNGGFWYKNCGYASPTASYLRGSNSNKHDNIYWHTFGGLFYSHKTIIFMIRRQNPNKLQ